MPPLTIICDLPFKANIKKLLVKGLAPHTCIFLPREKKGPDPARDAAFRRADIAIGQPGTARVLAAPRLRWVHVTSAGYTRYDTPGFRRAAKVKGLIVTNSSSVFANSCAEHVFAFMLAQTRQLPLALQRDSGEEANEAQIVAGLRNLRGQSVTIVGYGTIAKNLIRMLAPFDVKIIAVRRRPLGDEGVPVVSARKIDSALADADHVVDLLPANADSDGFFNRARFRAMKRGACFYNIGRGVTVDQKALASALRSGKLRAAWLDATTPEPLPLRHELRKFPNCHITPHIAGNHPTWAEEVVVHFIDNLKRFRKGRPLHERVI